MTANEEASVTPEFKLPLTGGIPFTDMEKSIAFYRDIVGFRMASDVVARFGLGGVLFERVPNPRGNTLPGNGNAMHA
jgi:catechol 2,3-dioxygenase-like lactoylglutathione lyase family enzyme